MILCDEHAGMHVLKGYDMAASHIMSWEDMDDMCPHCH